MTQTLDGASAVEPTAESADAEGAAPAAPHRRVGTWVGWALAALPAVAMTWVVLHGTKMQYTDYWRMVDRTFGSNGGLDVGGLFSFENEHPVVIPQILYWLNARLASGSNITLGLFVVAVVVGQLVVIRRFIPAEERPRLVGVALFVAASVVLFSRQGSHNFLLGMSGTAWLTANLLALVAILACWRRRVWTAVGFGVLASLTYGTGLLVWPALLATDLYVRRRPRPDLRIVAYGGIVLVGYFVLRDPDKDSLNAGVVDTVRGGWSVAGSILTSSLTGTQVLGALGCVVGIGLVAAAYRADRSSAAPWVGLFTFATLSTFVIGRTRWPWIESIGQQGRYASLAALFWLSLLGLTAAVLRYRRVALVPIAAVGLAALAFGGAELRNQRAELPAQEEFADAMRLDLADGFGYLPYFGYPRVAPRLEDMGHYPFDGSFDGDCGLDGQQLGEIPPIDSEDGELARGYLVADGRGTRLFGWVPEDLSDRVDCVLVLDWTRTVVGYGAVGVPDPTKDTTHVDQERAFAAIAPSGSPVFQAVLVLDDGTLLGVPGELTSEEAATDHY